jgi:hypothetical protein
MKVLKMMIFSTCNRRVFLNRMVIGLTTFVLVLICNKINFKQFFYKTSDNTLLSVTSR